MMVLTLVVLEAVTVAALAAVWKKRAESAKKKYNSAPFNRTRRKQRDPFLPWIPWL